MSLPDAHSHAYGGTAHAHSGSDANVDTWYDAHAHASARTYANAHAFRGTGHLLPVHLELLLGL